MAGTATGRRAFWAVTAAQARLWSGLVLFAFATTHFSNHAFGLVSVDLMLAGQDIRTAVTRCVPGTVILITAALVHFGLGVARFLKARSARWACAPLSSLGLAC